MRRRHRRLDCPSDPFTRRSPEGALQGFRYDVHRSLLMLTLTPPLVLAAEAVPYIINDVYLSEAIALYPVKVAGAQVTLHD